MGCDIHTWLEIRETAESPWQLVREMPCSYCGGTGKLVNAHREDCWRCNGKGTKNVSYENAETGEPCEPGDAHAYRTGGNPYSGRNYFLFAVLSGVRRYEDFDEMMGKDFEPICHAGVPDDLSQEMKDQFEDVDGHSHGWVTYSELQAAFLTMCDPSQGELVEQLMGPRKKQSDRETRPGYLREFWDGCVELVMKPLADKFGGENVRLILYYDN